MNSRPTTWIALLFLVAGAMSTANTLANGDGAITFGDVSATFQAAPIGFFTTNHEAALAIGVSQARIFPAPVETAHCENDWAVAMAVLFVPRQIFSHEEFEVLLGTRDTIILIDGVVQDLMTTAIKSAPTAFPFGAIWYENRGVFIAPGDLEPGMHFVDFADADPETGDIIGEVITHPIEMLPSDHPDCVAGG